MSDGLEGAVRVNILGPLEVWVDDQPVPIMGDVHRRALSLLAATPGIPVAADTLAQAVYRSDDAASLKYVVYRLRKLLGRDTILSARGMYLLDTQHCSVDLATFETWGSHGHRAVVEGEPEAAVRWLGSALDLWRGDPLPDLQAHPTVSALVSRLAELRFARQVELGAALATAGKLTDAVVTLEAVVADHPLREYAWVQLIAALELAGRTDEARSAYDRARVALAETGLEPGLQLQEAAERLVEPHDELTPVRLERSVRVEPLVALARRHPFAGRRDELGTVSDAVREAADGLGARLVLVSGEPGVGKTRLAVEAALAAHLRGLPVWFETPAPYLSLPYGPFAGLAQHMIADVDLATRHRLLAGPVAQLVSDGAIAPPAADHPEVHRYQLFEAVADFVDSITRGTGGVIVLDDMHESQAGAWQMLHHLVTTRPSAEVCVLVTMRDHRLDDEVGVELGRLRRVAGTSSVRLVGMSCNEIGELIDGGVDGSDADVNEVYEMSGGNPLYALGVARVRDDSTRRGDPAATATLGEAVDTHVSMLSDTCRTTLQAASVAGRVFSRRVLTAVAIEADDLDPTDVALAVEEAVDAGVVVRDRADPDLISFSHDLLRDALYRGLGKRQSGLHLLTGRALERLATAAGRPAPPAELAHHMASAWPVCSARVAARYLADAGQAADQRFEFASADEYYTQALRLLAQDGDPEDDDLRAGLLVLAAQARLAHDDDDLARAALTAAAELGRNRDWPHVLALAAVNYADSFGIDAPDPLGADLLADATERETDPSEVRADVLNMLHRVDPETATSAAWDLVSAGDSPARTTMLDHLWSTGIGESQFDVTAEMVRLGELAGDDDLVNLGRLRSWMTGVMLGRRSFDDKLADRFAGDVRRFTNPDLQWATLVWLGAAALARGELDQSMSFAERARRVRFSGQHSRGPWRYASRMATTYHSMIGGIAGASGDGSKVVGSVQSLGLRGSARAVDIRSSQARALVQAGRMEEARELVDDILREPVGRGHPDADHVAGLVMLGTAAALSHHAEAIESTSRALHPFLGWHAIVGRALYLGSVAQSLGLMAAAIDDLDGAVDYLSDARDAHRAVAADTWRASAGAHLAAVLWRRNRGRDRARAETIAEEAWGLAERIGMTHITGRPWPPA